MGKAIQQILKDPDRKSLFKIATDLTRLFLKYKSRKEIGFYATQLMYKKDAGKLNDYVHPQTFKKIWKQYYCSWGNSPLNDKLIFQDLMEKNNLPVPKRFGVLQNRCFYDREKNKTIIKDEAHLKAIFKNLLKTTPDIFVKPNKSSKGKGILRITKDTLNQVEEIDLTKDYIIQETLQQHPSISKIFPNCINVLRVITFRKEEEILFPSAHFTMETGDAQLANGTLGGITIGYNIETNNLDRTGYTVFSFGGTSYQRHPDTHFKFEGGSLTFNRKIKEILTKASRLIDNEVIGWDVALTDKGPYIMEGNSGPGLISIQLMNRGLLSNPLYCEIFKDYLN